jgi:chemotaxis protein CheD
LAERLVRMGELAAATAGDAVLVTIGLGSCIGLALVDGRVAGLAHIVLPSSNGHSTVSEPGKFGDLAVGALVEAVTAAGAMRSRLGAVLVGGAHMFSFKNGSGDLDIGGRNAAAVQAELERLRIPIRASALGGSKGRTVRVFPDGGTVMAKEAGGSDFELHGVLNGAHP